MAKKSRFQIAKKDIIDYFNKSNQLIYTFSDINKILSENKDYWRLTKNPSTKNFINDLITYTPMKKYELIFPSYKHLRFTWGEVSYFRLASSINNKAYLSHYSAMYLHDLTEQIPKSIFVNVEQSNRGKNKNGELAQDRIDRVFSREQRTTNNIASVGEYNIYLINGKFTNNLGVIDFTYNKNETIQTTDIERTLIDITVRPVYSGGTFEVLKAFESAAGEFSVNKLTSYLSKIDYTYPYHQCIGFYLKKSGKYKQSQIKLLKKFDIMFDFYLTYGMEEMDYDPEWRVYFPKGL